VELLANRYFRALAIVLLLQAAAFYAVASRPELIQPVPPLATFPESFQGWHTAQDIPIEKEVLDVLRADDTLNRVYVNPASRMAAYLFVAFFKTQRYGQSPHSPKNCLPGSGWEPVDDARVAITVPGESAPIVINRYVVQHGEDKSVTLYWYQSHGRIVASEYSAKFWLVADALRYHRSDTASVRITVPVQESVESSIASALTFAQAVFPELLRQLPL
jgi:EpsI family protein